MSDTPSIYICRADGEGATDYRVCRTDAEVRAFYAEEFCGADDAQHREEIDQAMEAFRDPDQWAGDAFHEKLYCATWTVWRVPASLIERSESAPIDMLLFCPRCQHQHVDAPEPEKGWTNPPHATHTCRVCGLNWRPSNALTNGVSGFASTESKHVERFMATDPRGFTPSAKTPWIAVADRLPADMEIVQACGPNDDDEPAYSVMQYDADADEWHNRLDGGCTTVLEVTHWMPLPLPDRSAKDA